MFVKPRSYWATRTSAWALAAGMVVLSVSCVGADDGKRAYYIEARSTAAALNEYARQSGVAIMFDYGEAAKTTAPALNGAFTRKEALAVLLANTRFVVASEGNGAIYLKVSERQGGQGSASAVNEVEPTEVVITGTRLREATASPVKQIGRAEIEGSGYGQTGDLLRAQPEIFAGGPNPGIQAGNSRQGQSNITNGSTIDLRGLGPDATLVLLNGKRLPANAYTQAPDISAIPLAALSRIEILTDGASAVYGADAVAGVVNFKLRKDFDGVETAVRVGGATQGGGGEEAADITAGKTWSAGYGLIGVSYRTQDPILAGQRDFTSGVVSGNSLIREDERKSVFLAGEHTLSDKVTVRTQGLFSKAQSASSQRNNPTAILYTDRTAVRTASLGVGADYKLTSDWTLALDLNYSDAADDRQTYSATSASRNNWTNRSESAEFGATGILFTLPSGPVRVATGLGYRRDTYGFVGSVREGAKRHIRFAYVEAVAPLVTPSDRPGMNRLDLNIAVRTEAYSDFGDTTTPKVGLRYVPLPNLTLRATWGKSFKAPNFNQTAAAGNIYYYRATSVGGTDANQAALVEYGGNPNLKPEKATSWTAGLDWTETITGIKVTSTYFHIDYTDRVVVPIAVFGAALSNPAYAAFVIRNPTSAQQAETMSSLYNGGQFYNFTGEAYSEAKTIAILKDRWVNATAQEISGVDLRLSRRFILQTGSLDASLSVTDLTIKQQTIPGAAEQTLTGTLFYPASTRLVSGVAWQGARLRLSGTVNYVSGGSDTGVTPREHIASWTTADLTASWKLTAKGNSELQLAVTNLFDRDPPYARGAGATYPGLYFDSSTASPVGRFTALTLRHRF